MIHQETTGFIANQKDTLSSLPIGKYLLESIE